MSDLDDTRRRARKMISYEYGPDDYADLTEADFTDYRPARHHYGILDLLPTEYQWHLIHEATR